MRWLRSVVFWRVATVVVFAGAGFFAWRLFNPPDPVERPTIRAGELGVQAAMSIAGREPVTARGYVFDGPGGLGLRLCDALRTGDPPQCLGPFVDLDGVDRGTFGLRPGKVDGKPMFYSTETVALRGTIVGSRMQVLQVLS